LKQQILIIKGAIEKKMNAKNVNGAEGWNAVWKKKQRNFTIP